MNRIFYHTVVSILSVMLVISVIQAVQVTQLRHRAREQRRMLTELETSYSMMMQDV